MRVAFKFPGRKCRFLPIFFCGFWVMPASAQLSGSSSLSVVWDQSPDTNAAGYNVYYGTTSEDYTNVIDAGNNTNLVISGVDPGATYYIAVTVYTESGKESGYSAEVSCTVPVLVPPSSSPSSQTNTLTAASYSAATGQFSFEVNGTDGSQYVVEASTNLIDWEPLDTNTVPFVFIDPDAANFSQRFYQALPME
jgi:fibronectin type 3 domain-containing protein